MVSLLSTMDTITVYDFQDKRTYQAKATPPFNQRREYIAKTLQDYGFKYDLNNDTLQIWYTYSAMEVGYPPIDIHAYSSLGEIHLSRIDKQRYHISNDAGNSGNPILSFDKNNVLPEIIRGNDVDSLISYYEDYGGDALDLFPYHVLRIDVVENRIKDVSEWVFEFP